MSVPTPGRAPGSFEDARRLLEDAAGKITESSSDLAQLQREVAGVHQVVTALGSVVETVMNKASPAFGGNGERQPGREIMLDLRAVHGCLASARLLIAPALDDLDSADDGDDDRTPAPDQPTR